MSSLADYHNNFNNPSCSRSFSVLLFLMLAGVSYGRFMAMCCKLICQRILGTFGDR